MTQPGLKVNILLVDDHRENLLALEAILDPLGHRLIRAQSGEEALKRLLTDDVAVILLDVMMPGMDGFETARQIKQRPKTRDIPILFLTAIDREAEHADEGFSTGAVDYLTKPVNPALLRAKVRVFVELHQKTELLKRQAEMLLFRLDERSAVEARQQRKLAEAAVAINSTLSLEKMLQTITDKAKEVIGTHMAELRIRDERGGGWSSTSLAVSTKYEQWRASDAGGVDLTEVIETVMASDRPVRLTKEDIRRDRRTRSFANHPVREGWMATGLTGRSGRRLGVLGVADKVDGDFGELDESVLVQLAQLAALAIENAERYELEHEVSVDLQRSLLPRDLPHVGGLELAARYRPGAAGVAVGGDWYDAIPLLGSKVGLSIGDVSGRGAVAAGMMGQLRIATRAYALQGLSPVVLMTSIDTLFQGLTEALFATAIYLELDAATGEMVLTNAGHPPPLVIDTDGGSGFLSVGENAPLGVDGGAVYQGATAHLERGGTLLLYTDGLVERRGQSLDRGLEEVRAAAAAPFATLDELCDRLLGELVPDSDDDVAILAARLVES